MCSPLVASMRLAQALDLDVEGLVAVLVEALRIVRHEGKALDAALEADVVEVRRVLEGDAAERALRVSRRGGRGIEGRRAHPLEAKTAGVDVGDAQLPVGRKALGLREQVAELVDRPLAVPGEVGRALAGAGRRIDVGRKARADCERHSMCALVGLADGDVGGREVARGSSRRPAPPRSRAGSRPRSPRRSRRGRRSPADRWPRRSGRCRRAPRCPASISLGRARQRPARTSASRSTRDSWAGSSSARRRGSRRVR